MHRGSIPLPCYTPARESVHSTDAVKARYPLALITAKSALHFLNSSYANLRRHREAEGEPLLDIHPQDAAARGISTGDLVRTHNARGELRIRARVGERVIPGMVAVPSGWWASLSANGSSANALTADGLSDMGGGADFHDTLVEVERIATM